MAFRQRQNFVKREQPCLPSVLPSQIHLQMIQISSDSKQQSDRATIADAKYLASYNWMTRGERTILIPGSPPRWCPPREPPSLREDRGTYYRDKNSSQYPSYPVEPGVRAILSMNSGFNGQEVDIFACGSTMGSLIAFLTEEEKTFRFGVEKVGNTLFLIRRENRPDELISNVYGYGHTFPEVYTEWDTATVGSDSHQRLVSYSLGDLKCIVRSESDGYLPTKLDDNHPLKEKRPTTNKGTSDEQTWPLPAISDPAPITEGASLADGLIRRHGGEIVPQEAIFDLKTRSSRGVVGMDEFFQRMCLNQTPNFILAYHRRGVFHDIQEQDVRASIKNWADENEMLLGRLKETLNRINALVEGQPDGRVEVRRVSKGDLAIWTEASPGRVLPAELRDKWMGQDRSTNDVVS